MSEYQYYEWQTCDRPLTAAERQAVDRLSSHITVTATRAIVTFECTISSTTQPRRWPATSTPICRLPIRAAAG